MKRPDQEWDRYAEQARHWCEVMLSGKPVENIRVTRTEGSICVFWDEVKTLHDGDTIRLTYTLSFI